MKAALKVIIRAQKYMAVEEAVGWNF